jgi:hypothetical protein
MLPGVLFAVGGAVMFALFESAKNYRYVHSAWHVCLSLSIVFLLPPKHKKKRKFKYLVLEIISFSLQQQSYLK